MKAKEIITKYADPEAAPLGAGDGKQVLTSEQRAELRTDLRMAIDRNRGTLRTAVTLIVILFIVNVGIAVFYLKEPLVIQAAAGVTGVSAAGLITWMIRLWTDKSRLEMLAVFAVNLEGDALKTLLNVLDRSFATSKLPA